MSSPQWQSFILEELAPELLDKNINGFFIDNCDVYYYKNSQEIFDGLCAILEGISAMQTDVIINGSDVFMDEYSKRIGHPEDIANGINQESIFTNYNYEKKEYTAAESDSKKYFTDYIERYSEKGMDIYLIEYTTDEKLIREIQKYCDQNNFFSYIADDRALDGL